MVSVPPIEIVEPEPSQVLSETRALFIEARSKNLFIDVLLVDSKSRRHGAHRLLLITAGEYFRNLLMNNEISKVTDQIIVELTGYSGTSIRSTLGKQHLHQFATYTLSLPSCRLRLHGLLRFDIQVRSPNSYGDLEVIQCHKV